MMRTRVEANRLVRAVLGEICQTANLPVPRLVVDTSGPDMTIGVNGRPVMRYPMHCARTESEDAIRGTIAHEISHVVNGDITAQPLSEMAKTFAKVAILLSPALLCGELAMLVGRFRQLSWHASLQMGWLSGGAALLVFVVLLQLGWLRWPEFMRHDRPRQFRELRADLTAVRLVGHEPVLAFLEDMARRERITLAGRRGSLRLQAAGGRTHPQTSVRMHAVRTYGVHSDPDAAAEQHLGALQQLDMT